jgi:hypothetical protein
MFAFEVGDSSMLKIGVVYVLPMLQYVDDSGGMLGYTNGSQVPESALLLHMALIGAGLRLPNVEYRSPEFEVVMPT